jgi:hypothetical protein
MQRLSSPELWKRSITILIPFAETLTIASVAGITEHTHAEAGAVNDTSRTWLGTVVHDRALGVADGFRSTGIGLFVLRLVWVVILVAGSMPHAWLGVAVWTWRKGGYRIMVGLVSLGRKKVVHHIQAMVYGSMGMLLAVLRVLPSNGTFPFTLRISRHKCQFFILGKVSKFVACWKTFT